MKIITFISLCFALTLHAETPEWSQAIQIFARIAPPQFPAHDFVITSYGAVAGGSHDCTAAIAKAIDACAVAGGGRVMLPVGYF